MITEQKKSVIIGEVVITEQKKPVLQLSNEDGNAFSIIGRAMKVARLAGWSQEKIDKYRKEATSGDYDHLLQVTIRYFDVE